jgi:hypothetical protein
MRLASGRTFRPPRCLDERRHQIFAGSDLALRRLPARPGGPDQENAASSIAHDRADTDDILPPVTAIATPFEVGYPLSSHSAAERLP